MPSVTHTTRGLVLTEHEFSVPLDHASPAVRASGFSPARSPIPTEATGRFSSSSRAAPATRRRGRRGIRRSPGWLDRALQDFRVLMLDQRGTGRSTPVGTLPGLTAAEQAEYLEPLPRRLDRAGRGG